MTQKTIMLSVVPSKDEALFNSVWRRVHVDATLGKDIERRSCAQMFVSDIDDLLIHVNYNNLHQLFS
jgi:hypothetical protein